MISRNAEGEFKMRVELAEHYDIVGYMEDDLLIEDSSLREAALSASHRSRHLCVSPHRCEHIPGNGDVIVRGSRWWRMVVWATGETIECHGQHEQEFLSRNNPHSGCFFSAKNKLYGSERSGKRAMEQRFCTFRTSGTGWQRSVAPGAEINETGGALPVFDDSPQDELWKRHTFESDGSDQTDFSQRIT